MESILMENSNKDNKPIHIIDKKILALQFNDCINNKDLDNLAKLMSDDYVFISKLNDIKKGKEYMLKAWIQMFNLFPNYKSVIHAVFSKTDSIILIGQSDGGSNILDGPCIWTAFFQNELISEWRIYEDNETSRNKLDISTKLMEPLSS